MTECGARYPGRLKLNMVLNLQVHTNDAENTETLLYASEELIEKQMQKNYI
jgi:hypothetical protein